MTTLEIAIRKILKEYSKVAGWIGFTGGNVSVSKKWLEHAGGFDENFGLRWGCEDLELGYRLFLKAYPFDYSDRAINYHIAHYRHNFDKEHSETIRYFYNKHGDQNILCLQDFIEGKITRENFIASLAGKQCS